MKVNMHEIPGFLLFNKFGNFSLSTTPAYSNLVDEQTITVN